MPGRAHICLEKSTLSWKVRFRMYASCRGCMACQHGITLLACISYCMLADMPTCISTHLIVLTLDRPDNGHLKRCPDPRCNLSLTSSCLSLTRLHTRISCCFPPFPLLCIRVTSILLLAHFCRLLNAVVPPIAFSLTLLNFSLS